MDDKAYAALEAIECGTLEQLPDRGPWLKALQTVCWAYESPQGFALTPAGHRALHEMKRTLRSTSPSQRDRTHAALAAPSWQST
jgi:hypothetical protein